MLAYLRTVPTAAATTRHRAEGCYSRGIPTMPKAPTRHARSAARRDVAAPPARRNPPRRSDPASNAAASYGRTPTGAARPWSVVSSDALAAAILAVVVVVAYVPAIGGGFVWDDDDYVTANASFASVDGLARIWLEPGAVPQYYPLTFTSFWLEYQLFGARRSATT